MRCGRGGRALLLAVEVLFALGDTLLKPQDFLAQLLGFVFGLSSDPNRLLFRFEEELPFPLSGLRRVSLRVRLC